jgi:ubiquinone biosynthesis protein Coq4
MDRATFEGLAAKGLAAAEITELARHLKQASGGLLEDGQGIQEAPHPQLKLAASFVHVAFAAPDRIAEVYDAAAAGWLGEPVLGPPISTFHEPPVDIAESLWTEYWSVIEDFVAGTLGTQITPRTAALNGYAVPDFVPRAARAALTYPGVREAAATGYPDKFTLDALALCPQGSLGNSFYHWIVDNGFDLEVLDRDELGLSEYEPPLDYLNARILQCHDLWHIVGGYHTTILHELAISGFQMAQFGHNYSATFMAVVTVGTSLREPAGFGLVMDMIATSWKHGRETPSMIGVRWDSVWDEPTQAVRDKLGVSPYESPYPPDLVEQLQVAAAAAEG